MNRNRYLNLSSVRRLNAMPRLNLDASTSSLTLHFSIKITVTLQLRKMSTSVALQQVLLFSVTWIRKLLRPIWWVPYVLQSVIVVGNLIYFTGVRAADEHATRTAEASCVRWSHVPSV